MIGNPQRNIPDIGFGLLGLLAAIIGILAGFVATSQSYRIAIVVLFVVGGLNSILAGKFWSGVGWLLYAVGLPLGFYVWGRWGMLAGFAIVFVVSNLLVNTLEEHL